MSRTGVLIEVKNRAEQLIYSTERTMREAGDKIDGVAKSNAQEKIEELRKVLNSEDASAIQDKFNELEKESHAIAEQLYKSSSGAQASSSSPE